MAWFSFLSIRLSPSVDSGMPFDGDTEGGVSLCIFTTAYFISCLHYTYSDQ